VDFNESFIARFEAKVGEQLPNGCKEWQANRLDAGYGLIRTNSTGSARLAHRAIYEYTYGAIPQGGVVMHSCDNPRCVNIKHLVLGIQKDNVHDMVAKGRHSWKDGTAWQKLSKRDARTVKMLAAKEMTQQRIADLFGVSRPLISMLLSGKFKYAA
jgi:hypothetical protein